MIFRRPSRADREAEDSVVVLASGDPGFFGIVRLLGERFGGKKLRVLPGLSSVTLGLRRAGLSSDDAVAVSAGGDPAGRQRWRAIPRWRFSPRRASGRPSLRGSSTGLGEASWSRRGSGSRTRESSAVKLLRWRAMNWNDPNVVLVLDERAGFH